MRARAFSGQGHAFGSLGTGWVAGAVGLVLAPLVMFVVLKFAGTDRGRLRGDRLIVTGVAILATALVIQFFPDFDPFFRQVMEILLSGTLLVGQLAVLHGTRIRLKMPQHMERAHLVVPEERRRAP